MVTANLVALVQSSMKRMLPYSSIAHAGYLLVAITAANETAAAGLLFYLLVYAIMNTGAFAVVIAVGRKGEENPLIVDYAGLGHRQPLLGVLLTLFLLSLAGFPGTGGFIGKIYLLRGALDAELWSLAVLLVLTTVVSYYLRVGLVRVDARADASRAAQPDRHSAADAHRAGGRRRGGALPGDLPGFGARARAGERRRDADHCRCAGAGSVGR
jgi:NADH:ubiquinone oxidoreductase subunit 2 (subunit N)